MGSTQTKDDNGTIKKRRGRVKYKVTVKTNDVVYGGSDGVVQIKIVGDIGSTRIYTLNNWYDGFEKDKNINVFSITDIDIGNIIYINLCLMEAQEGATPNYWFVEDIQVTRHGRRELVRFPIYEWLVEDKDREIFMCNNYTSIPQYDFELEDGNCRTRRMKQTKRDTIQWVYSRKGLPGHIAVRNYDVLDLNLRTKTDLGNRAYKSSNEMLQPFLNVFTSFECLDDFLLPAQCISSDSKIKSWVYNDKWKKDEEFGRQILNGLNPGIISRCTKLPDDFFLQQSHVEGLLVRGLSLEEEINLGNVYLVNYSLLNGISTGHHQGKKIEIAAPICMLYLRTDGELVPIAIQLRQNPGEKYPIWTPKDDPLDWLLVKMWFKNADLQVHQVKSHYALTHIIAEIFAVAMYRCLPSIHPIFKLLKDHLRSTIPTNVIARKHLIPREGALKNVLSIGQGSKGIEELLQKSFDGFQFDIDFDFPANITHRGMADIPNYYFRDDGLKLWGAIKDYTHEIVNIFYISNDDVIADWELQEWIEEIYSKGLIKLDTDGHPQPIKCGFPKTVATKIRLVDLLTKIVFSVTVAHASVNYQQFEYMGFPPCCPGTMRGSIPGEKDRGMITTRRILDSLPDQMLSAGQVELSYAMSCYSSDDLCLTNTPSELLFTDREVLDAMERFQNSLRIIEEEIKKRNEELKVPYDVLVPSKIPYGIRI